MLSILIPVYNYNILSLVNELHHQVVAGKTTVEILVYEDGSQLFINENQQINTFPNCIHKKLSKNIGRSAIRNLLASEAKYEYLLFLDADIFPCNRRFLQKYIDVIKKETEIISGGLLYQKIKPQSHQMLRWKYGHAKESLSLKKRLENPYQSFLSSNFLINKSVFEQIRFNEVIPNLACEDTLFAIDAKSKGISIKHINNPVYHLGLETSSIFLKKSLESIKVRKSLLEQGILSRNETKITKLAYQVKKARLTGFVKITHHLFKKIFKKNILSKNPSMLIFDLYRLGHYFEKNTIE